MKIYAARHGQTSWNAQNRILGRTDLELTETGLRQAEKLAETVQSKNIDIILSSPLKRAVQTSEIIAKKLGVPIKIDERLIEQNYGIYEGEDRKNAGFLNNKRNFAYRYPGGESMMQVAYRVYSLIEEIKNTYSDKTVLIVCHGGVLRVFRTYFYDMTNDEFVNYIAENTELREYEI